jgi:hypothetical protein
MLRRSAAKRSTYPIQCWLSRGGNGKLPFIQAQLKARITASNHQRATRRRSGCLPKSRPRTADPAKLASPTTTRKASLEITNTSITTRLLFKVSYLRTPSTATVSFTSYSLDCAMNFRTGAHFTFRSLTLPGDISLVTVTGFVTLWNVESPVTVYCWSLTFWT